MEVHCIYSDNFFIMLRNLNFIMGCEIKLDFRQGRIDFTHFTYLRIFFHRLLVDFVSISCSLHTVAEDAFVPNNFGIFKLVLDIQYSHIHKAKWIREINCQIDGLKQ